ncbi:hypothetical protein G6F23_015079 [Rhizopus arrhizus]|nr:hypothetical protein G6F23_015079 [Rhizopus arrhizus]
MVILNSCSVGTASIPICGFKHSGYGREGSYYAGISTDVEARFAAHQAGKGARYTRARPPLRVLAVREYPDRAAASRAEWQLKQQPRERKLAWLQAPAGTLL